MSKFNVGDKVRVVYVEACDAPYFQVGAEGTIVQDYGHYSSVQFTAGEYSTAWGGQRYVLESQLEKIVPYSSSFTKKAAAEPTTGHVDGSGLQKHSIGGLYPLAVVGYARDAEYVMWVVENLETGKVACNHKGSVRQWERVEAAQTFAERYANVTMDNCGEPIIWRTGRPAYPLPTRLTME